MRNLTGKTDYKRNVQDKDAVSVLSVLRKNTLLFCNNLCMEGEDFEPSEAVVLLYNYINKWDRILYSSISDFVFVLPEERRGLMIANIERLYDYTYSPEYLKQIKEFVQEGQSVESLSKYENIAILRAIQERLRKGVYSRSEKGLEELANEVLCEEYASKLQKIILKILDHINLATNQYVKLNHDDEYFERKIAQQAEKMNSEIDKKLNDNSKENMNQLISLIGIFTALSFIVFGSLTSLDGLFSQIQGTHTLKLVLVGSLWGLAVFNLLSIFEYFISRVAGKRFKYTDEKGASFYQKYPLVLIGNTILGTIFLLSAWLYFIALEDMGGIFVDFVRKYILVVGPVVIIATLLIMLYFVSVLRKKKM